MFLTLIGINDQTFLTSNRIKINLIANMIYLYTLVYIYVYNWGFPGGTTGKEPTYHPRLTSHGGDF